MLAASASLLNIRVIFLDKGENSPAKQIVVPSESNLAHLDGSFADPEMIRELAGKVNVLTVEIEHVDAATLEQVLSENKGRELVVHPSPSTIKTIQDKFLQKEHLTSHSLPVAESMAVEPTLESIQTAAQILGLPLMLKSRTLAYDGRGNFVLHDLGDAQNAIDFLGNRLLYAEKWINFFKEIAVMVVRTESGHVESYPVVETIHKNNICHLVFAPLRTRDPSIIKKAKDIAESVVKSFTGAGIFGVEMFLLENGKADLKMISFYFTHNMVGDIVINEVAPRPHNSGHYTIEACETSQYENHLRAILSLPLGSTALKVPSAAMFNLIGHSSRMAEITEQAVAALEVPGASVHLYGKSECRKGRKMGHITVVAESDAQLRTRVRLLLENVHSGAANDINLYAPIRVQGFSDPNPLVGVIMGSDSDLPVMLPAAHILDQFEIPYELTIVSAHRTPDRLVEYARSASTRGLRTIIAGAGGAAHLPGMVAAMTALPVIGVPVKGSSLDGVDSLYSIVQMPVSDYVFIQIL